MMKIRSKIRVFLGLYKSIIFNLRYLPFKTAVKLPVLIERHVKFVHLGGTVSLDSEKIRPGLVQIGFGSVGIFDRWRTRTLLEIRGHIHFAGQCGIGHGTRISVLPGGELVFGENFSATSDSQIVCQKKVLFGRNVLVGWSCLIMDTDFHRTINTKSGEIKDCQKDVIIGDNAWLATRSLVLKGTVLPPSSILAAGSVACKDYSDSLSHTLFAGVPAKAIKHDIELYRD